MLARRSRWIAGRAVITTSESRVTMKNAIEVSASVHAGECGRPVVRVVAGAMVGLRCAGRRHRGGAHQTARHLSHANRAPKTTAPHQNFTEPHHHCLLPRKRAG